ncbi:MAG TPA: hypothetical protein VE153_33245 [Myxococcus sp.]|nr:hypothetical protein [Myxococcus sp.]
MARKKPEAITLYGSLETDDDVAVELAVSAPTRGKAQRVLAEITRAVTGEDLKDPTQPEHRVVLTEGAGLPAQSAGSIEREAE